MSPLTLITRNTGWCVQIGPASWHSHSPALVWALPPHLPPSLHLVFLVLELLGNVVSVPCFRSWSSVIKRLYRKETGKHQWFLTEKISKTNTVGAWQCLKKFERLLPKMHCQKNCLWEHFVKRPTKTPLW